MFNEVERKAPGCQLSLKALSIAVNTSEGKPLTATRGGAGTLVAQRRVKAEAKAEAETKNKQN